MRTELITDWNKQAIELSDAAQALHSL
jgi:hypothetical protein